MRIEPIKFDSYSIIKRLVKKGFKETQAKELVDVISENHDHSVATKLDLMELENRFSKKIADVENRLSEKIAKTDIAIEKSKNETIKWLIASIVTICSTIIGCFKFFSY